MTKMYNAEGILKKIEKVIPDFETFERRIVDHVRGNSFPLIYQCLYERIMPSNSRHFTTEKYKFLLNNNFLELINDIYRTRLSEKGFHKILKRLDDVKDFNDYEVVLKKFEKCNPRKGVFVNAFSLGTKVLHVYNPEENPILDSVIRQNLGINYGMDIELCLNFKNAMNDFVTNNKEYFLLKNSKKIKNEFKKYYLKTEFPKMKILDMALY